MNVGKLSELILKRSVINKFRNKRAEVISGARAGGDAAIMQIDGRLVTAVSCSTEGDFFNPREMGLSHILTDARITAIRAVNSVSAEGGSPFALLIAMILPPTIEEKEMKQIMRWAGPRMLWRHPILTVRHLIDDKRPVPELPEKYRPKKPHE